MLRRLINKKKKINSFIFNENGMFNMRDLFIFSSFKFEQNLCGLSPMRDGRGELYRPRDSNSRPRRVSRASNPLSQCGVFQVQRSRHISRTHACTEDKRYLSRVWKISLKSQTKIKWTLTLKYKIFPTCLTKVKNLTKNNVKYKNSI